MKNSMIMILISGLLLLSGCEEETASGKHEVNRPAVRNVTVTEVKAVSIPELYETTGTLKARNTSNISAKIMGTVKEIMVTPGQKVRKGDLLIVIDSPDIEAGVIAAEKAVEETRSDLDIAKEERSLMSRTFERFKKLFEARAITVQEFDEITSRHTVAQHRYEQAEKSLQKAKAALEKAKAMREFLYIRSPLNGIVAKKMIDEGSMASPGIPLMIIEEKDYVIEAAIDEGLIDVVKSDTKVRLTLDSLGIETEGTIEETTRQVDPRIRRFTIKIKPAKNDDRYRGGIYSKVSIQSGIRKGIFVPSRSIVHRGNLTGVYTVDETGVITLQLVKAGKSRDGLTEVLSGLKENDRIITNGLERAVDGGILK